MAFSVIPLKVVTPRAYTALVYATADADTGGTITIPFPYQTSGGAIVAAGVFLPLAPQFYTSGWYYGPGPSSTQIVLTKQAAVGSGTVAPQAQITVRMLEGVEVLWPGH